MAIRYNKLVNRQLPVAFFKQQYVLVSLIAGSFLLLILSTFFTSDIEYDLIETNSILDTRYGVIVDCGSSGTRAHIFTWIDNSDISDKKIKLLRDVNNKPITKHITPGLSTLSNDPDSSSDYMEPLMDFIADKIPQDHHIDTPIHFMATAGMRLLDDATQKRILSDITRDLRMKYNFPKIKGQVISGEYEGVYSWLSLNMNRINHHSTDNSKSLGLIELGGASAQVTFELEHSTEQMILSNLTDEDARSTFRNEQIRLNLDAERSVKLFTTSFLGLGVNSARESEIDILVRDYLNGTKQLGTHIDSQDYQIDLFDPCLPLGSSETVIRPFEVISNLKQSLGFILRSNSGFKVKLEGSGDFFMCITLLERVIEVIKSERLNCSPSRSCPMLLLGHDFIPYYQHPFVGLSEMFFTTNEMMNSSGLFNRAHVLEKTKQICSTKYDVLHNLYSTGPISFQDRILYECFKATWLLTLLHNSGIRMPSDYNNFRNLDRIDGEEIDWTIGAMFWDVVLNKVQDG